MDYAAAPYPYFLGILKENKSALLALPLDEVFIYDIDSKTIIRRNKSDAAIPKEEKTQLIQSVKCLNDLASSML